MGRNEEMVAKLIKALEWFIEISAHETNDTDDNAYFIAGLEGARKILAEFKGEEYVPGDWESGLADYDSVDHWEPWFTHPNIENPNAKKG